VTVVAPYDEPERSEAEQLAFFEAVLAQSEAAAARLGSSLRTIDIAGVRIGLRFAGEALERLFIPPLAHLEVAADGAVDVLVHVWDSASSGVRMAPPPCPRRAFTRRGDIWGFNSERVRTAFHWSDASVCVFDHARNLGAFWVGDPAALPYWTTSAPLRTIFSWIFARRGCQLTHAAAVGEAGAAVLITGRGGAGKSTTALACLRAGMQFLGDDYVLIGLEPQPTVHSLYASAKLQPDQARLFGELFESATLAKAPADKDVAWLHERYPDALARSAAIVGVASTRFDAGAESRVEPVAATELHRALVFSTVSQLPHAGAATYDFFERLIRACPGRRLVLGSEPLRSPEAVRELIRTAPTSPPAPPRPAAAALISAIVPVHNGAQFLNGAVASILEQDYPALEIIVVDDGSTDDIETALASLPVDVRCLFQPNSGPAEARNAGVRAASGDYVAFLDVDDLWTPGTLATLMDRFAADPRIDIVRGRAQLARMTADRQAARFEAGPQDAFVDYLGAGLYRRAAFDRVGLFDRTLRFGEDADWFTRAREAGLAIEPLDEVCLIVRRHERNMTAQRNLLELNTLRVVKKALDRKRAAAATGEAG
jgi:hypothetical protein